MAVAIPAKAQIDEIIVTGNRISEIYDGVDAVPPHVTLDQRANYLVRWVRVECDTRDLVKRKQEIRSTLRNMLQQSKINDLISLATGDQFIRDFTEDSIAEDLQSGRRVETSYMRLLIKTPVDRSGIQYKDAIASIDSFVKFVRTVGRTEVVNTRDPALTLVDPEQYRGKLLALITADAKATALAAGPGYSYRLGNMAQRVRWIQNGTLSLSLYIPYDLEIVPAP
jgi:hypothetical protein